ncbi:hypothetical protein [Nesterenkonia haasae]|uniref:hypothetical protein n=1 Tax=Nesterenkonia haasae TaxID=2587813 RepID=UPI001391BD18|nr:hypothetical protein [Nesterenkonia haasae]NDK31576.1 hypothetical protein [Nesterenkonia haasae]
MAPQDWAGPVLGTAYAKPLVARLLTRITPALSVRATSVGWSVASNGRPGTACTSSTELLDRTVGVLEGRGVGADSVENVILLAPEHRAITVTRDMFPAAMTSVVSPERAAVRPTRLIHAVLAASLTSRMRLGADPEEIVIGPSSAAWTLRVG